MWVSPNCHPLFPFSMKSHLELQFGNKSNNEAVKSGGNFLTIVCQAKMLWRHLTKTFLVGNIFSQKANARFCGSHKECFRTKAAAFFSSQRVNKSQEGGLRDNLLLSNVNQGIHTISSFHHDS